MLVHCTLFFSPLANYLDPLTNAWSLLLYPLRLNQVVQMGKSLLMESRFH